MIEEELKKMKTFSKNMRKHILKAAFNGGANSSHFGGALSSVEIVSALYSNVMNLSSVDIKDEKRDRFILSKGHACLVLYAALVELNLINEKELETFEKNDSRLLGHPVINRDIGIEFTNGSLGMGLSLATGVAIALLKKKLSAKVYVLLGDGECNEGSNWEAVMLAHSLQLNNLTVIVDNNNYQQSGQNHEVLNIGKIASIWKGFGWDTYEVDGHNSEDLIKIFNKKIKGPKAIIAKTIKGKGFSFSENNNEWHHKVLSKEKFNEALEELK
tara:strand:- start:862 stop:1677 length:816 start_codon:yes stop_codon:yes gene_type:complete